MRTCAFLLAAASATFLLAATPANAQVGKITGVVTDATTGEQLVGAQVFLVGTGRGALSDERGRYFLLNVPVGTYTLRVELIGYASAQFENLVVATDVTRVIDLNMQPQAIAVAEVLVEVERQPLIELTQANATSTLTSAEIEALPVTSLQEALALQQGFLEVPDNTDVLSVSEQSRNVISPVRIRGGRGAETLMLIDGVPVANWVLGGPALDITNAAIRQVDLIKGGFEPQYGNALSGIINIATIEGGTELEGLVEYQTSELGGVLGNTSDDIRDFHYFQGRVSGPVPGTAEKLRFALAGRFQTDAYGVYEFDDEVFDFRNPPEGLNPPNCCGFNQPNFMDLFPGWRAIGFDDEQDLFAKLTYWVTPAAKLSVSAIDYERKQLPFDFVWLLSYDDPLSSPLVRTAADSAWITGNLWGNRLASTDFGNMVKQSSKLERQLYVATWDQTLSRAFYRITAGIFDQKRLTCSYFEGVCLEDRFQDINFTDDRFHGPAPAGQRGQHPTMGTDAIFGGEDTRTWILRGDVNWQLTDHHNLQFGGWYQNHDFGYRESEDFATNTTVTVLQEFELDPYDFALYIQDRIEYDFLTLRLGFRFDYGQAPGRYIRDPLDPTAGTTAEDVCEDPAGQSPHLGQSWQSLGADPDWAGLGAACGGNAAVLDSAAQIAYLDDFVDAEARTQFSPRLGISFPVTSNSSVFFNYGIYSQNPTIRNTYNQTGIGTPHEALPLGFALKGICPSTFSPAECEAAFPGGFNADEGRWNAVTMDDYRGPRIHDTRPEVGTADRLVGNPNLLIEKTTAYEIGYLTELGDDYGLSLLLFTKDQTGLTGFRTGGTLTDGTRVFDAGATYGTARPQYTVLINSDYQTVRGFEIRLQRRLSDFWGFDVNYSYSEARTNAAALDRALEAFTREGDTRSLIESRAEIDQPHVFNGTLRYAMGEETPFGSGILAGIFKRSGGAITLRAQSGLPYTPVATAFNPTISVDRLDRNSSRAPGTWQADVLLSKDFRLSNMNYGLFLRIVNLFDTKNCVQVFATTGNCDSGAADQDRAARQAGNPASELEQLTSTWFDRPNYLGPRRSFNFGVRVSF